MLRRLSPPSPLVAALAFVPAVAATLGAQDAGPTIGAGVVSIRYADAPATTLSSLTATWATLSARTSLALSGTYSTGPDGLWSAQGALAASRFTGTWRARWTGEASLFAGGSTSDGPGTGQGIGALRVHRTGERIALWVGAGAGALWDGSSQGALVQGDLGGAARVGEVQLVATLTPTVALDSVRYTDARLVATLARGRVEYRASLGARAGDRLALPGGDRRGWGDAGATVWLGARLALLAGVGLYPADPTQGFPSGRYAALSLRIGGRRPAAAADAPSEAAAADGAVARRAGLEAIDVRRVSAGRVRVRVRAPRAGRVELTGDLTAWAPVPMRAAGGGWWELEVDAAPGRHELTVRLDGGAWLVPPGLAVAVDEFGGRSGVLVVP